MQFRRASRLILLGLPCLFALPACGDDGSSEDNASVGTGTDSDTKTGSDAESADEIGDMDADTTTADTTTADTTADDGTADETTTADTTADDTTTADTTADDTTTSDDESADDESADDESAEGSETGEPCGGGGEGFDFSYLWVANTNEGSVSKVNTQTVVEEARYRTGPNNVSLSPSRTTVSFDGHYALIGNRNAGSVTLVAADEADCIDTNNDGEITTSLGPNDLLDWGDDECVLWSTDLPDVGAGAQSGPRGMTFDPGEFNDLSCTYDNPKVWVGWHGTQATQTHMARLNPADGVIEEIVDIDNWTMGWSNYPPYGAALDGDGDVWFTALRGEVFRINSDDLSLDRWAMPASAQAYGMTVDPNGDAWFGGCSGPVTVFDSELETFTAIPNTQACHRGVAADSIGNIWVASNGPCGLVQIDAETKTVIKFHTAADFENQCSTPVGVSIDVEGFVWMVDQAGWAWKMDPETYAKEIVMIAGNHYTYSDMTGGGLVANINPQ